MAIIEKLGTLYLGKEYDLKAKKLLDEEVYYDARDLTTHGVIIGMTGSGKTGLAIDLLEDAAIDKVPAIIIDPKGDMTNLLLTFPDLLPEDFQPWVNPDDAARKGMTLEEYAAQQAELWRTGLASWDQGPERIRMLKDACDFTIYTPGSDAGVPVSVVSSFRAPEINPDEDAEAFNDRVGSTVAALFGLLGMDADPVRSRDFILLTNIVDHHWRQGKDLSIQDVIRAIQKPPFGQLGVVDLETFYPEKERFELAMSLNNLIASPGFAQWLKGEPIDVGKMFFTKQGKPRVSIFYIAHLSDQERMFVVTLLLGQIIGWMRGQSGTSSLRALLYMDEVFGYLPPQREPPSKRQFLTLLKQARAFGLGLVLSTQNPVDLDYKALSNAGTWFIGKLQTERDKLRLMEGLQTIGAQEGVLGDSKALNDTLSSLPGRVFLLHSIHEDQPLVFQTRWAMSYLAGPLTRPQIKTLMADRKAALPASAATPAAAKQPAAAQAAVASVAGNLASEPPIAPPGVDVVFLPRTVDESDAKRTVATEGNVESEGTRLVYEPAVLGSATVRFFDSARGIDTEQEYDLLLPLTGKLQLLSWKDAVRLNVDQRRLPDRGEPDAMYVVAQGDAPDPKKAIDKLSKELDDHLYSTETYEIAYHPKRKLYAKPGESEREFKARCLQATREQRDAEVDTVREKYTRELDKLQERRAKEASEMDADKAQYTGRLAEEAVSGLGALGKALGLFGRKSTSGLRSVASKRRMSAAAQARVRESEDAIAQMNTQIAALKPELQKAIDALSERWDAMAEEIQTVKVSPRRSDISVEMVALAWAPSWWINYENARGHSQLGIVPAYPAAEQA
jgi:hypothetical protein